jgi:hypothetical protein
LIHVICEPTKGESPLILPPAAQTLAETAKALLSLIHVRLLELSIIHKHSYARWQKVANLMLEKDFGIPKIHCLRLIHLYEADLNLLMGIYFARTLVSHIEHHDGFNIGCYGNRPGLSAHEPVLVKELQNSFGYLSRTNQVVTDNDATACYDRIPRNLANLTSRSNGMDNAVCTVHGQTLDNLSYSLLTALVLSIETYTNSPNLASMALAKEARTHPRVGSDIFEDLRCPWETRPRSHLPVTRRRSQDFPPHAWLRRRYEEPCQ